MTPSFTTGHRDHQILAASPEMRFRVPLYHPASQARSQARFDQIITAAREHIATLGIADLSLPRIAAHAGVPVQSVYRYFPDIRGIFGKLLEDFYADMDLFIQGYLRDAHQRDQWRENLTQFVDTLAAYAQARPYIMKMQLICRLDAEMEGYWWQMVETLQMQLVTWLRLIGYRSETVLAVDMARYMVLHLDALLLDLGRTTNKSPDQSVAQFTDGLVTYLAAQID